MYNCRRFNAVFQLILNNVHIRYEDDLSLPNGLVFNCGVRIQKMTVQTTNAAGVRFLSSWCIQITSSEVLIDIIGVIALK